MNLFRWLAAWLFGCLHTHVTFPITLGERTYQACLHCGEHLPFDPAAWRRL